MNIEQALERCNELIKAAHANWIGISNQIAIRKILNYEEIMQKELIETKEHNRQLALELEKKDKEIDEMTEYITNLDIDEDICKNNITQPELCNEEYSNCKECIKQYFYKKVE